MRKLQLVKGHTTEEQPRQRHRAAATERRFRYPAEEVWEVSERWEGSDSSSPRDEAVSAN